MKRARVVFLVVALVFVAGLAFGFDFGFSIKAGVNFPFMTGSGYDEWISTWPGAKTKLMVGFKKGYPPTMINLTGGVGLTFGLFDFLAIQPEILYTMTGFAFGDENETAFLSYSVIEVPLLIKLRLTTASGAGFHIYAGPDVHYLLLGTQLYSQNSKGEVLFFFEDDVKDAEYRLIAGGVAGVEFRFPSGALIEARYALMFLPIGKTIDLSSVTWQTFDVTKYPSVHNSVQIMLGFSL
ncbi:MAG: PorT family protein [Spirochaetales bacterium]|nr:PorT family protein [Spirochaetales bacterium]